MQDTTITCLCDNNVKLSTKYWGEHGISFYIETPRCNILFDTGQTYDVISHNAKALGKSLDKIDKIVLSHGHYDHTGGLEGILGICSPTVYAHPAVFEKKFKKGQGSELEYIGMPKIKDAIISKADVKLTSRSIELTKSLYTTGEIPRVNPLEVVPEIFIKGSGGAMVHDALIDDQALIVENEDEAVVLLGCNHAGLINTIEHCKKITNATITNVMGGTHLANAPKERMEATLRYLELENITLYGFHCTGDSASYILKKRRMEAYEKGYVGMVFTI